MLFIKHILGGCKMPEEVIDLLRAMVNSKNSEYLRKLLMRKMYKFHQYPA